MKRKVQQIKDMPEKKDKRQKKAETKTVVSKGAKKKEKKSNNNSILNGIPYTHIYENGMMDYVQNKDSRAVYSEAYFISEADSVEVMGTDSAEIREKLGNILTGFPEDVSYQLYVVNSKTSEEEFLKKTLVPEQGNEKYTDAVKTYNGLIHENCAIGHNNMKKDRYIVFSLLADCPEEASERFDQMDETVQKLFYRYCGMRVKRLSAAERLELVYNAFNVGADAFGARAGMTTETFDLKQLGYMSTSTKELVAPKSVQVEKNYVLFNDKVYARTFFINNFPIALSDNLISDITNISSTMICSSYYQALPVDRGFELSKAAVADNTKIRSRRDKTTLADRKAGKIIQQREMLRQSEDTYFATQALEVFTDSKASGQKVFLTSFLITLFAENTQDLDRDTKLLMLSAAKFAFQIKPLDYAQMEGFRSVLPLANSFVDVGRVFTVFKLAALAPISVDSVLHESGTYNGLNAINDNLILMNRTNTTVPCGLIAGMRSSGKTYQVKREAFNNLVTTKDVVFIIAGKDQAEKYTRFVKDMDGTVIDSGRIDPFKMCEGYGIIPGDDGTHLKTEYLTALCAAVKQFRMTLADSDAMTSEKELEEEVQKFSRKNIRNYGEAVRFITDHAAEYPVMFSAFGQISRQYLEGEGKPSKRLTLFEADSADAMLMALERVWQICIALKMRNVSAWVYIDNVDDIIRNPQGADYLKELMRLADILKDPITIVIQNSAAFGSGIEKYNLTELFESIGYYKLLNEGAVERKVYANALHIQASLLPYVTNAGVGKGLIVDTSTTVPFNDNMKETAQNYEEVHAIFK